MTKTILPFLMILFIFLSGECFSQTPGGINFQGVAMRSTWPYPVNSKEIKLRFAVRERFSNGPVVYYEVRKTTTDSFGVFSVVIGGAGADSQSINIKKVKWSDTTKKFLQVQMDVNDLSSPGYKDMGTTQLLSVPFSFYSDISDSSKYALKSDSSKHALKTDSSRHALKTDSSKHAMKSDSSKYALKADSSVYAKGSGRYFFSATIDSVGFQILPAQPEYNYTNIIKFPIVLENEGNHYDPTTGVFTAPDNGHYQFFIQFSTLYLWESLEDFNTTNFPGYALVVNDKVVRITEDKNDTWVINFSTMLKLNTGDKVSFRTWSRSAKIGFVSDSFSDFNEIFPHLPSAFAEFSGYKIK